MAQSFTLIRNYFLLSVFVLSFQLNTKGDVSFQKIFNAFGEIQLNQTFQTHDSNGFVLGGTIEDSLNPAFYNFLLVRTDTLGAILWAKVYGPASNSSSATFCLTSDGGFLMAGQIDSLGTFGTEDILITKLDSFGNIRWSISLGGLASDAVSSVTETQDSGFIIAANSYSFGSGNPDIYIIKLDKSGNKIWSKFLGNNIYANVRTIKQTMDGGYILVGLLIPPYDILLVKVNSVGIPEWSRTFGGVMEAWGYDVVQASDSGFIVLGMTRDGDASTVFKTNPSGDLEWTKILSSPHGTIEAEYIQVGRDNNYLIGGHAPVSPSNTDLVLLSINLVGNVLWSISTGTLDSDFGGAFSQVHDSTITIIGNSIAMVPGGTYFYKSNRVLANACDLSDISISDSAIMLDIDSGIIWSDPLDSIWIPSTTSNTVSINETILCIHTGQETIPASVSNIEFFPNPFTDRLTIRFDSAIKQKTKVEIINILGQVIFSTIAEDQEITLPTVYWKNGLYQCVISDGEGYLISNSILHVREE